MKKGRKPNMSPMEKLNLVIVFFPFNSYIKCARCLLFIGVCFIYIILFSTMLSQSKKRTNIFPIAVASAFPRVNLSLACPYQGRKAWWWWRRFFRTLFITWWFSQSIVEPFLHWCTSRICVAVHMTDANWLCQPIPKRRPSLDMSAVLPCRNDKHQFHPP